MAQKDGMNYAPKGIPAPVVKEGEFPFAAVGLDHGHIYGMTNGLLDAGATLKWVYDPDPAKMQAFKARYPQVRLAESEEQVLADPAVKLVAGACVTSERAALGVRVMRAGKDYFTDKAPLTTLEQLAMVKNVVAETGRKYAVNYSERLQVEAAVYAGELVKAFLRETFGLLKTSGSFFSRCNIVVMQCDDAVRDITFLQDTETLEKYAAALTLNGGGGTDFRPAFARIDELQKEGRLRDLQGVLYFTDGKGTFPARSPAYQTAFLFLEDGAPPPEVPPWAIRLVLAPEEFMPQQKAEKPALDWQEWDPDELPQL